MSCVCYGAAGSDKTADQIILVSLGYFDGDKIAGAHVNPSARR